MQGVPLPRLTPPQVMGLTVPLASTQTRPPLGSYSSSQHPAERGLLASLYNGHLQLCRFIQDEGISTNSTRSLDRLLEAPLVNTAAFFSGRSVSVGFAAKELQPATQYAFIVTTSGSWNGGGTSNNCYRYCASHCASGTVSRRTARSRHPEQRKRFDFSLRWDLYTTTIQPPFFKSAFV